MKPSHHLIIFTRYPIPGHTKTRLIPVLGDVEAANLQRKLTEHTVMQADQVSSQPVVQIWYSGGTLEQMQTWLGRERQYYAQQGEGLGDRLMIAIATAFQTAERVVVIGIDCPELSALMLERAFRALHHHDAVIGPATDGGYYLIGLRRMIPELFEGVDWGTERVFEQTLAIAQQHQLTVALLPPLTDIDLPEEVPIWQRVQSSPSLLNATPRISVIIPTLNEAATITQTVKPLVEQSEIEVIVVDGGSQDQTLTQLRSLNLTCLTSPPGRAKQMNRGATVAQGEVLLFLHADTQLPNDFVETVFATLAQPGTIAGAFELQINGSSPWLRWIEAGVKWRSHFLQLPYGDQALFIKTLDFWASKGFPELPIMEDFEWVRQLQRKGKIRIASTAVLTSGRRWLTFGIWRTTVKNQLIILGYFFGLSPHRLARWYRQPKR